MLSSSTPLLTEYKEVFEKNARRAETIYKEIDANFVDLIEVYFGKRDFNFARLAGYLLFQFGVVKDFDVVYEEYFGHIRDLDDENLKEGFRRMTLFSEEAKRNNKAREFVMSLGIIDCLQEIDYIEKSRQDDNVLPGNINSHNGANKKPFYDLASGSYSMVYFRKLSPVRKYIFVDINPFVVAYLNMAKEVLNVENIVDIREEDILDLQMEEQSVGTVRLHNIAGYIDIAKITNSWLEQLIKSIVPGGQIIVGFKSEVQREINMPLMYRLRKMLNTGNYGGWQIQEEDLKDVFTRNYNSAGSSLVTTNRNQKKGGIAFNALPVQAESVSSSALGALAGARAFKGDLDAEWGQIQAVFNAGIRPSVQRLVDFAAAGAASPLATRRREDVLGLVAELLRRDEEDKRLAPTDPTLKGLLNALESLS